ncbi:MAG: hypothetical protein JWL84_6227 [Rhodospirillales bacterium]|nr:hypothetical protein [Rhodospirillales bacterium]
MPERRPDAGLAGVAAGGGGDAPAGHRDAGRRALPLGDGEAAPAPQHQRRDAARLGSELQAAAGGRRQHGDLAEHGGERARAQPLLHRPEDLLVGTAARQDQPVRRQTVGGEAGRVEIVARGAPQHAAAGLARQPGENAGGESGSDGAVLLIRPRPQNLVQRAEGDAATRQRFIERGDCER